MATVGEYQQNEAGAYPQRDPSGDGNNASNSGPGTQAKSDATRNLSPK
jgi:hypothetical protein